MTAVNLQAPIALQPFEGDLAFWVGGSVVVAREGSFVYGPKDIPHTFTVSSPGIPS